MRVPARTIRGIISIILLLVLALAWSQTAHIASAADGINSTINFQGKLTNTDGTNVTDGSGYDLVFRLYDASSGGTELWSETHTNVSVTDGIFRVALGSVSALDSTDFETDSLYLSIQVTQDAAGAATGDSEMDTRIRFSAVPYAFNAQKVNGLTVTNTSDNPFSTATTLKIADGKTIQFNEGLTLSVASDTDGKEFIFPAISGASDTVVTEAYAQTLTNKTIGSTGLVFNGASTDITTVSNEHLVISPHGTGNVGIGNTAPEVKLDVTGSASVSGSLTIGQSGVLRSQYGSLNFDYKSGANTWATGMVLDDVTGYVGIGITAPTDVLSLASSTTSRASLNIATGVAPTGGLAAGDIYSDGTNLYYYNGSGWDDLTLVGGTTNGSGITYVTDSSDDFAVGASDTTAEFYFDLDNGSDQSVLSIGVNESLNGVINLYSSGVGLSDPQIYADSTGDLVITAPSGQVELGDGSGNVEISLTQATDGLLGTKVVSLTSAYGATDYTFQRTLTSDASGETQGGTVLYVYDDSAASSYTANATMLKVNAALSSGTYTGNLLDLQVSGSSVFAVDSEGNALLADGQRIDTLSSGTLGIGTSTATTISIGRTAQTVALPAYAGNNAVLYANHSTGNIGVTSTTTENLCLLSGTASSYQPVWGSCSSGTVSTAWDDITQPDANLSLNMTTFTHEFNWDTGTGTNNLFNVTTDASSNGTGYLVNIATGLSSTVQPLRVYASNRTAIAVDASGNVGIGVTNPQERLFVADVTDAAFAVQDTTNGVEVQMRAEDFQGFFGTQSSSDLRLITGGSSRVTIDTSGNMGVGDSGPDAKLEVLGTSEQLRLTHTDGTVDTRFTVDSSGNLTLDASSDGTGSETLTLTGFSTLNASELTSVNMGSAGLNVSSISTPSNGNLTLTPNGTGDVVVSGDGDTNLQVNFGSAPGVDMVSITNQGQGATATDVDGLSIVYETAGTTASADNAALRINVISNNSGTSTTLEGLYIGNLSSAEANSTERAIRVGTGWDVGLSVESGGISVSSGGLTITGGGITLTDAGSITLSGSSRRSKTITLSAEYPGAAMFADGSNNTGTMTSDYTNSETSANGTRMTYYEWNGTTGSGTDDDYDIIVRFRLPDDFSAWAASTPIVFNYATETTTSGLNSVDFSVYLSTSSTADATDTGNVSGTSATWTTTSGITTASLGDCNAAGEVCLIHIHMVSEDSNYVRVGDIQLNYLASY